MQISKWGNSLALRIPAAVVEALELKEGDEIKVRVADPRSFEIDRDQSRERALATLRSFHEELPPGWKFDREEANSR